MKKGLLVLGVILSIISLKAQDLSFAISENNVCGPVLVTFTNTSTNVDAFTFQWEVDGRFVHDSVNLSHYFTDPGDHYVRLSGTDSMGYGYEYSEYVNIYGVSVNSNAINNEVCPGGKTSINVQGNYSSIKWIVDDSLYNENDSYIHPLFNTEGQHEVMLIYESNECPGDTIIEYYYATSSAAAVAEIYSSSSNACPGDKITFSTNYYNEYSYSWNFGDGSSTNTDDIVSYSYDSYGDKIVILQATNFCGNSATDTVIVNINDNNSVYASIDIWDQNTCPNTSISFRSSSTASSYYWDLGNGQTSLSNEFKYSYSDTGTYNVMLAVANSCGSVDTNYRSVYVDYYGGNTISAGFYIDNADSWSRDGVEIDTFTFCPNTEISLSGYNYSHNNESVSYMWSLGNGDTLNGRNVSTSYLSTGVYELTLVLENGCKDIGTKTKWIVITDSIKPKSWLRVLPDTICPGEAVYFFDDEIDDSEGILNTYSVWYGDGDSTVDITTQDADSVIDVLAKRTYTSEGSYNYIFEVKNGCGQVSQKTGTIIVSSSTNFEPYYYVHNSTQEEGVGGNIADSFDDWSKPHGSDDHVIEIPITWSQWTSDMNKNFVIVLWYGEGEFDGDATSIAGVVEAEGIGTHKIYVPNQGQEKVNIFAIWSCGSEFSGEPDAFGMYGNVSIPTGQQTSISSPGIQFENWDGRCHGDEEISCPGDYVTFGIIGGESYMWHFGDGFSKAGQYVRHKYINKGVYNAFALATNKCGRIDTVWSKVTISDSVSIHADFKISNENACVNEDVSFYAYIEGQGNLQDDNNSFYWNFGDGSYSNEANPSYSYSKSGSFVITLTLTNNCGFSSVQTRTINIEGPSINMKDYDILCSGGNLDIFGGVGFKSYSWSTGEVTNIINVTSKGNYTVTITDNSGCSATGSTMVYDREENFASAGNDVTICSGGSSMLIADGGINFKWSDGSSDNYLLVSPSISLGDSVLYTVTVTDVYGCQSTDDVFVHIGSKLSVNLGADINICDGSSATVFANGGTSYSWSPSLGLHSDSLPYAVATPNTTTTYILTVGDGSGCTGSDNVIINVNVNPSFTFTGGTALCKGDTATIGATVANGGVYSYEWYGLSDTNSSISIKPDYSTTYYLTVADSFGCKSSDEIALTVNPLPYAYAGFDKNICDGQTANLKASGGVSYLWSNGALTDSIIITPVSTSGSTYVVTVTDLNGCSATDDVLVKLRNLPVINAGPDITACSGVSTNLVAHGAPYYYWSTGEKTKSITFIPYYTTYFLVWGSDYYGCTGVDTVNVTVDYFHVEFFTVIDSNTQTVTFQGYGGDDNSKYYWEFDDGSVSNDKNPVHQYSNSSVYNVCLTVFDTVNGCQKKYCEDVVLKKSSCNADFYVSIDSLNNVSFTDASTGNITNRIWNFNDGTFSSNVNQVHQYKSAGFYYVCLTIRDTSTSCYSTKCKDVKIGNDLCKSDFTYFINSVNNTVKFTDASSGRTDSWYWTFGDRSNSQERNPSHVYTKSGIYKVCLSIMDSVSGCQSRECIEIQIGSNLCNADFTDFVDFNTQELTLTNTSIGSSLTSYWIFGDGNYESTTDAIHKYENTGLYNVCLKVFNTSTGCSSEKCKEIVVGSNVCVANYNYFINPKDYSISLSQKSSSNITSWSWNFGDGYTAMGANTNHKYSKPGYYLVSLSVYDSVSKCSNHYAELLQIGTVKCYSDFDFNVDISNLTVTYENKSSSNIKNYFWELENGIISTDANPVHTYKYPGLYRVKLTVADSTGMCMNKRNKRVQVGKVNCSADFTYFVDSITREVKFNNEVLGSSVNLNWEFGDGSVSNAANPTYTYSHPGYYYVSLSTYNSANNCMDYYSEIILVGSIGSDCESDFIYTVNDKTVSFSDKSIGGNLGRYLWYFGEKRDTSLSQNPVHTYTKDGFYKVCLTVFDTVNYCKNTDCKDVKIGSDTTSCLAKFIYTVDSATNKVTFIDKSIGRPSSWLWIFNENKEVSTVQNPSYTYSDTGFYYVRLIVKGAGENCKNLYGDLINVHGGNKGLRAAFGYQQDIENSKKGVYPTDFAGASFGEPASFAWNFGDGNTDETTISPTNDYSAPGTYNVCLTVSDAVINQENTFCDSVQVGNVSIKEINNISNVFLYPIPSTGIVNVILDNKNNDNIKVEIFNIEGMKIKEKNISVTSKNNQFNFDLSDQSKGVYFMNVIGSHDVITKKIIIQ